jgi:hypothetical protein
MPAMERLYQTLKGRSLVVLAMNYRENLEVVRAIVQDEKVSIPIVLDPKGSIVPAPPSRGLPATYVFDRNQIVVGRTTGHREWDGKQGQAYFGTFQGKAV